MSAGWMCYFPPRVLLAFALAPLVPPALVTAFSQSLPMFGFGATATYASELAFGLPLYWVLRRSVHRPLVTCAVGWGVCVLGMTALGLIASGGPSDGRLVSAMLGLMVGGVVGAPLGSIGGAVFWAIAFLNVRKTAGGWPVPI